MRWGTHSLSCGGHDEAVFELGKAIELEPSVAQAHYALGMARATSGCPKEALPHIDLAMRLSRRPHISGSPGATR